MLESLTRGDFYILCPDNETTRGLDERRMAWAAGDIIENRPALSRWHPDYKDAFAAYGLARSAAPSFDRRCLRSQRTRNAIPASIDNACMSGIASKRRSSGQSHQASFSRASGDLGREAAPERAAGTPATIV